MHLEIRELPRGCELDVLFTTAARAPFLEAVATLREAGPEAFAVPDTHVRVTRVGAPKEGAYMLTIRFSEDIDVVVAALKDANPGEALHRRFLAVHPLGPDYYHDSV